MRRVRRVRRKIAAACILSMMILSLFAGCAGAGQKQESASGTEAGRSETAETARQSAQPSDEPSAQADAQADAGGTESPGNDLLGTEFPDFTIETVDGGTFTLSEALADKQAVVLNIFATWCGPCRNEFPEMVKSCEERKDQVEVLLIDRDHINGDNAEKVKKFVEEMGLPFRAAYEDETVIGTLARFNSYPVTIVIDRFGKICYVRELCFFNKGEIDRVLDTFLGDDYKESVLLTEVPGEKIDVAYPDSAELSEALNATGTALVFDSDPEKKDFPFVPTGLDGRTAAAAFGGKVYGKKAAFRTKVQVDREGTVLAFDVKTEANTGLYSLFIEDNGKIVTAFSGTHEWDTCAVELPTGEHEIRFIASREEAAGYEEIRDFIAVDEVRVLTGDEAAELLAAQPVYPFGENSDVYVEGEDIRQVKGYFGGSEYPVPIYIVPGKAVVHFTLARGSLVDTYILNSPFSRTSEDLVNYVSEDGSDFSFALDMTKLDAQQPYAAPHVFSHCDSEDLITMLFRDEGALDAFCAQTGMTWEYMEEI